MTGVFEPRHVVWELTLACDLACGHCGSSAAKRRRDELSTTEALDLVSQLRALGAREVSLIGGEAYLREDWTTIARAITDAGMICSMVTGALQFDARRARQAKEARVDSVSISIDGIGGAHDAQRGVVGSFERAVQAFAHLAEAGVPFSANSQLNRVSFPYLDEMLELFASAGAHAWQVAMTVPMGRAQQHPEWLFQPEELLILFPKLDELAMRSASRGMRLFPGNNVGYFGPHEETLRGGGRREGAHYQGCSAGTAGLGIEADGSVKGCPSLPSRDYVGGNIRDRPVAEIRADEKELTFNRTDRSGELWGFCATCYYRDTCLAGCSWTAHVFFGRRGNNPYCHHRALEQKKRGLRERLTQRSAGDGSPFDYGSWDILELPLGSEPTLSPILPLEPRRRLPMAR